jgi:hypothetical protein
MGDHVANLSELEPIPTHLKDLSPSLGQFANTMPHMMSMHVASGEDRTVKLLNRIHRQQALCSQQEGIQMRQDIIEEQWVKAYDESLEDPVWETTSRAFAAIKREDPVRIAQLRKCFDIHMSKKMHAQQSALFARESNNRKIPEEQDQTATKQRYGQEVTPQDFIDMFSLSDLSLSDKQTSINNILGTFGGLSRTKLREKNRRGLSMNVTCNQRQLSEILDEDETIEFPSRNNPAVFNKDGYYTQTIQEMLEKGNAEAILKLEPEAKKVKKLSAIIKEIDVSHLTLKQQQQVKDLFMTKEKLLSKHSLDIGKTNVLKAKITLKDTETTFHQKYVPIPPAVQDQVEEIIEQYIEYDILAPCDKVTNHVSNIFVIRKKSGLLERVLWDARLVNANSVRIPSHVATNSEIIHHFSGKRWLTLLDITNAFYSIELEESCQPLTSFYDHKRRRLMFK